MKPWRKRARCRGDPLWYIILSEVMKVQTCFSYFIPHISAEKRNRSFKETSWRRVYFDQTSTLKIYAFIYSYSIHQTNTWCHHLEFFMSINLSSQPQEARSFANTLEGKPTGYLDAFAQLTPHWSLLPIETPCIKVHNIDIGSPVRDVPVKIETAMSCIH